MKPFGTCFHKRFSFLDFKTHSLEGTVSVTVCIKIAGYLMGMQSKITAKPFDAKLQCYNVFKLLVFNLLTVKKNHGYTLF